MTCLSTGNLAGLALAPILLQTVGWRGLFYVFGLIGAPLLAFWLAVVPPPTPRAKSGVEPPSKLSAVQMMSKSATWAIIIVNFVNHWGESQQVTHVKALGLTLGRALIGAVGFLLDCSLPIPC